MCQMVVLAKYTPYIFLADSLTEIPLVLLKFGKFINQCLIDDQVADFRWPAVICIHANRYAQSGSVSFRNEDSQVKQVFYSWMPLSVLKTNHCCFRPIYQVVPDRISFG